jgi:hypothetical protein
MGWKGQRSDARAQRRAPKACMGGGREGDGIRRLADDASARHRAAKRNRGQPEWGKCLRIEADHGNRKRLYSVSQLHAACRIDFVCDQNGLTTFGMGQFAAPRLTLRLCWLGPLPSLVWTR